MPLPKVGYSQTTPCENYDLFPSRKRDIGEKRKKEEGIGASSR